MKKILAVSGGVDSMVMLDMMRKRFPAEELVVATFDHGTRKSSRVDADFVSKIGSGYNLRVRKGKANLGEKVSEEVARKKRYEFLRKIAAEENGEIYTAHHIDDLIESVAINLSRGTGFRGLSVLTMHGVKRPFLDMTLGNIFDKRDILKYAAKNNVIFRHDPTNTSDSYLRNRLRPDVSVLTRETKNQIYQLWEKQTQVVKEIDKIVSELIPDDLCFERMWFKNLNDEVCHEILRAALASVGVLATRPQINDFLKAIREYSPTKMFNLPNDKLVRINRRDFTLKI